MNVQQTIDEITNLILDESKRVGEPIITGQFQVIHQPLGHTSLALPKGRMAVYTFVYNDVFLKVGQANQRSKARYQSHHYYVKSNKSTLANSLLKDPKMSSLVNNSNITNWIKTNCERFDVLIDAKLGKITLNFIEGLLQYKYQPKYEG